MRWALRVLQKTHARQAALEPLKSYPFIHCSVEDVGLDLGQSDQPGHCGLSHLGQPLIHLGPRCVIGVTRGHLAFLCVVHLVFTSQKLV